MTSNKIQIVPINLIGSTGKYIKREILEGRRIVEDLFAKWGSKWADHIGDVKGHSEKAVSCARRFEPLKYVTLGTTRDSPIYVVHEDLDAVYNLWERGERQVEAVIEDWKYEGNLYTLDEIVVQPLIRGAHNS